MVMTRLSVVVVEVPGVVVLPQKLGGDMRPTSENLLILLTFMTKI